MKNEKTDRRARYTRMVLKESLIELLKEKRISNISIKEICERADINRSTFYSHYQDQYDLVHQVEQEVLGEIREYLDSYSFDANESESLQLMNRIFQYIAGNGELCKTLLGENGNIDFQKEVMMIVQSQCIKEWTERRSVDPDTAEYLYTFTINGSIGIIQRWLKGGLEVPVCAMAEMVIKLTNQGLSAFV